MSPRAFALLQYQRLAEPLRDLEVASSLYWVPVQVFVIGPDVNVVPSGFVPPSRPQ